MKEEENATPLRRMLVIADVMVPAHLSDKHAPDLIDRLLRAGRADAITAPEDYEDPARDDAVATEIRRVRTRCAE